MPDRVQLRPCGGWRLADGARSVARPHRWGNYFVVGQPYVFGEEGGTVRNRAHAVDLFRRWMAANPAWVDAARRELAGLDLACWCPLDQPCHADVLLGIANPAGAHRG